MKKPVKTKSGSKAGPKGKSVAAALSESKDIRMKAKKKGINTKVGKALS